MSAVVFLRAVNVGGTNRCQPALIAKQLAKSAGWRSEEHTSELQSQSNLVCRLLLEKKKKYGILSEHICAEICKDNYQRLDETLPNAHLVRLSPPVAPNGQSGVAACTNIRLRVACC